jgi:hypothetical protein
MTEKELKQTQDKLLKSNYELFRNNINNLFPDRADTLNVMYDYFEDRLITLPASSIEHYHNAFPGGYIDHVIRVAQFAEIEYYKWKELGLNVNNFTLNELLFAAYHHDLGKVGMVGNYKPYQPNTSEWHRKNQGKLYNYDTNQPFMLVPDLSLFNLQKFNVPVSWSEYLAIRTHDGVYDRANEAYYFSSQKDSKPRTNINQILHQADYMAARFEFEQWAEANPDKFTFYSENSQPQKQVKPDVKPKVDFTAIDEIFKDF